MAVNSVRHGFYAIIKVNVLLLVLLVLCRYYMADIHALCILMIVLSQEYQYHLSKSNCNL